MCGISAQSGYDSRVKPKMGLIAPHVPALEAANTMGKKGYSNVLRAHLRLPSPSCDPSLPLGLALPATYPPASSQLLTTALPQVLGPPVYLEGKVVECYPVVAYML